MSLRGPCAFFLSFLLASSAVCAAEETDYARERQMMVDSQIAARGIKDKRILDAVGKIERHKFIPEGMRQYAYEDISLPVGGDEAVPPAYFVSLVAQLAGLKGKEKVLELGIESGYQAAVLAELSADVYCVEPSRKIALEAGEKLKALGYKNIKVKTGRIDAGWLEFAPYDVIVITSPIDFAPQQAIDQLMPNGRMVMPLREYWGKKIVVLKKTPKGKGFEMTGTLVTPLTGEAPSAAAKETPPKQIEGAKWEAVKGSKWMKKK
ncbi:MAG: protein-L-isoaspartate O-methyltransferase [Candidatus Omnitrophica bacterium]|nr:protein-L-isoaspartate O-methyltransferase [Candidatus Omnitrophota bacterium]MDD5310258.1 protein-L-isoaspartate O-methyltransferase [Candidatus Omnitrophota bacterium]